jgi:hypothetical protein
MVTANTRRAAHEPSKLVGLLLLVVSLALVALPIASIVKDLRPTTSDSTSSSSTIGILVASSHPLAVLIPLTVVPTLVLLTVRWIGLGLYLRN